MSPPRRQSATVTFSGAGLRRHARARRRRRRPRSNFRPTSCGQLNFPTTIKARLKHLKQLKEEPTAPKVKIKFTATDEFGWSPVAKVRLCSRLIPSTAKR